MDFISLINQTFKFKVGSLNIAPTYWQAATIVFLIFLLVFTLARVRWLYVHWSMGKGSVAMLFWGFVLALVLEGFLILGGKTLFTTVLGWDDAPKPISTALDIGRAKLVDVLGAEDEFFSQESQVSPQDLIDDYRLLNEVESQEVRNFVCKQ